MRHKTPKKENNARRAYPAPGTMAHGNVAQTVQVVAAWSHLPPEYRAQEIKDAIIEDAWAIKEGIAPPTLAARLCKVWQDYRQESNRRSAHALMCLEEWEMAHPGETAPEKIRAACNVTAAQALALLEQIRRDNGLVVPTKPAGTKT